jgi:hypothetical protein
MHKDLSLAVESTGLCKQWSDIRWSKSIADGGEWIEPLVIRIDPAALWKKGIS